MFELRDIMHEKCEEFAFNGFRHHSCKINLHAIIRPSLAPITIPYNISTYNEIFNAHMFASSLYLHDSAFCYAHGRCIMVFKFRDFLFIVKLYTIHLLVQSQYYSCDCSHIQFRIIYSEGRFFRSYLFIFILKLFIS